jgi:hypothetical protein
MNRAPSLALLALVLAPAACGPTEPGAAAPAASAAAPKVEQQKVLNMGYFDLSTLWPSPPAVTGRASNEALLGVELGARPVLMECLVDPKNRGAEKKTHVVVDASLSDAGVDHKVTGENLTPAGTACIEAALAAWTKATPALAAKNASGPVKSHLEFEHIVGTSPAVEAGVNDVSEIAGAIRLALRGWGGCFDAWKTAPPRVLRATVKAERPAKDAGPTVAPSEVTFDASADPDAGKVAACLQDKIKVLQVKTPASGSVALPYTFRFVHSGVTDALPDAPPELQFIQIDLQRARRAAETAIAIGDRVLAAGVYEGLVKRFKAKSTPAPTVKELQDQCVALLAADDRLLATIGKQVAIEDAGHRFTADQKAKDPSWAEAEAGAARNLAAAQKDAQSSQQNRKADQDACPKLKY